MTRDELRESLARHLDDAASQARRNLGGAGKRPAIPQTVRKVDIALSALSAARYAVVPLEATEAMINAAHRGFGDMGTLRVAVKHAIAKGNILEDGK